MSSVVRNVCRVLLAVALVFSVLVPVRLSAQVTTADVVGTVTDDSGAVVPNAKIAIQNQDTHESRTTTSNSSGDYTFNLLPPGAYTISIEAPGYKTLQIPLLRVSTGDRARANATLPVGAASETVEVTATTPVLQADSSALNSVVTEQSVQDVPLNGRNFISLVQNAPGVNAGPPNSINSGTRPDERRQTSAISANGQIEALNNNMIDGMDNNEREQGLLMVRPSIDAIQEVQVTTNTYTAEVGNVAGAAVNVITKSGTNKFHGTAYEFLRNDKMDANSYFSNQTGLSKPKYKQHQFGGSAGGFIRRDKTFFFGDAEELRIVQGTSTGLLTVPTLYEEQNPGDFRDQSPTMTPLTATQIDSVARQYFGLFPAPRTSGTRNNFSANPVRTQFGTTVDARVDQHFSDHDMMYVRYAWNPVSTFTPGFLPAVNGIQPGGGSYPGTSDETAQGVGARYFHTYNQGLIMELGASYTRLNIASKQINYGNNSSTAFGIPNVNYNINNSGLMPLTLSGYSTGLGDSTSLPIVDVNNVFQYLGSVTWTRGAHNIKFGGGLIRRQLNYYQPGIGEGQFAFSTNSAVSGGAQWTSLYNLLLGSAQTISRQTPVVNSFGLRGWEPNVYVQDDWHVTSHLTLNLGLRWDFFSPLVDAHNYRANFSLDSLSMIVASSNDRSAGVQPAHRNWAPRFGFAESPGHGFVIRGGFGFNYYGYEGQGATNLANAPYYYVFSCQPGVTSGALQCPAGIGRLNQGPPLPVPQSITPLTGSVVEKALHYQTSYIEQFNLAVQKQIGQNVITVAYVGELGRHQQTTINRNLPVPTGNAKLPAFVYATQLPGVSGISYRNSDGTSSYHALQAIFERRLSKGLVINANYVYARNLNDFADGNSTVGQVSNSLRYDWGNSDIDVRHRFAITGSYELPFGSHLTGFTRQAAYGWEINTLAYYQTGLPYTVMDSVLNANKVTQINLPGVTSDRPNRVSGTSFNPADRNLNNYINLASLVIQPIGTPGNEGRNQLYSPNTRELDLSLFKTFPVHADMKFQFRAEVFNLTNTANFAGPNATITTYDSSNHPTQAGSFGQVTSTLLGTNPRDIQLALKFLF